MNKILPIVGAIALLVINIMIHMQRQEQSENQYRFVPTPESDRDMARITELSETWKALDDGERLKPGDFMNPTPETERRMALIKREAELLRQMDE